MLLPSSNRFTAISKRFLYNLGLGLGLGLCLPAISSGAAFLIAPRFAAAFEPAPDDAQAAILLGFEMPFASIRLGTYGEFEFRVFGKDRILPVTPTLRLQLQEMRYTWGTGFYLAIPLNREPLNHITAGESDWHTEARLGGGVGYSLGDYRGTNLNPESLWVPWIDLGYGFRFGERGSLTLGYQYRPLPHTSPHRIALTYGGVIHLGSARR